MGVTATYLADSALGRSAACQRQRASLRRGGPPGFMPRHYLAANSRRGARSAGRIGTRVFLDPGGATLHQGEKPSGHDASSSWCVSRLQSGGNPGRRLARPPVGVRLLLGLLTAGCAKQAAALVTTPAKKNRPADSCSKLELEAARQAEAADAVNLHHGYLWSWERRHVTGGLDVGSQRKGRIGQFAVAVNDVGSA